MLQKNNTKLLIFIIYSTINWKNIIDKINIFYDEGKMPCILVENKADLLDKDELIIFKNWKNLQNIMI